LAEQPGKNQGAPAKQIHALTIRALANQKSKIENGIACPPERQSIFSQEIGVKFRIALKRQRQFGHHSD